MVSSDWSDTMLDIAVTFFYHPIYMIIGRDEIFIRVYQGFCLLCAAAVICLFCSCLSVQMTSVRIINYLRPEQLISTLTQCLLRFPLLADKMSQKNFCLQIKTDNLQQFQVFFRSFRVVTTV